MLSVTPFYIALFGIMSVLFAGPAGFTRGKHKVSIGDGGHQDLLLAVRRHGNFTEWVPIALLVFAALELRGVSPIAIHSLCGVLVVARFLHFFGLKADTIDTTGRFLGTGGTVLSILVASVWLLVTYL